tara:strand:+ start:132 stop:401 length:270 start_codon:yes stop_codon:yes gene_type:complete
MPESDHVDEYEMEVDTDSTYVCDNLYPQKLCSSAQSETHAYCCGGAMQVPPENQTLIAQHEFGSGTQMNQKGTLTDANDQSCGGGSGTP